MSAASAAVLLVPFQAPNGQWGYLDATTRKPVIAPQFMDAHLFKDGLALVAYPNPYARSYDDTELYDYIRPDGKPVFAEHFTDINPVIDLDTNKPLPDLREVVLPDGSMGITSIKTGGWIISPIKGRPGYAPQFNFYSRDRYLVDGDYLMVDGRRINPPSGTRITSVDFEHHLLLITKQTPYGTQLDGLANWQGKALIAPLYVSLEYFPGLQRAIGLRFLGSIFRWAAMRIRRMVHNVPTWATEYELLTDHGKVLRSFPASREVDRLRGDIGYSKTTEGPESLNAQYFSLLTGKDISALKAENANGYHIFYNSASGDIFYGLETVDGKRLIPTQYRSLAFITPQLLIATDRSAYKQGVIDVHGKTVILFEYRTLDFDNAGGLTASRDGQIFGVITFNGETVVPPFSTHEILFDHGRADVYRDGLQGVLAQSGKLIVPIEYKTLFNTKQLDKTGNIWYQAEDAQSRWGLLDANGKTVIPFHYGFLPVDKGKFAKGWVKVEDSSRNHQGLVNIRTGVRIPPEYSSLGVQDRCIVATRYDETSNTYSYQLLNFAGHPISAVYTRMDAMDGHYFLVTKDKKMGASATQERS